MKFVEPQPYEEALQSSRVRSLLRTSMSSRELALLKPEILARARFSAKVRSAEHLSILGNGTDAVLRGEMDFAKVRVQMKQFLARTSYVPPEGKAGTIEDLSSFRRTDLQVRMNVQMAQGYGWHLQGQDPTLLDAFPARRFVRVEARETPRTDWPERWNEARAATTAEGATDSRTGVMAALVGHPIWVRLNVFGHEYEPFDWGSGMGTEDMARAEAIELGLIDRDTQIPPQEISFNEDLRASPDVRNARLRAALEQSGVGRFNADGVFVYAPREGGRS